MPVPHFPLRPTSLSVFLVMYSGILSAQVHFQKQGKEQIAVAVDGKPFTTFFTGSAYPKPFLAPLRAADGTVVTRHFPMEQVRGETQDHPHHRGLFIGYGDISGVNFWENERSYTTNNRGNIVLRSIDRVKDGARTGTLGATFDWNGPDGKHMLLEVRNMTFSGDGTDRIIDFDERLTAQEDVAFADTKEGFFAIRLADSLREAGGDGHMLNSTGAQGEKEVWGKRADWVEYHGSVGSEQIAVTIFDHPGNPNHPPRWHARAYGLFAVNPFGRKDFDPHGTEKGGLSLAKGQQLRFRYRVLIHSGDLSPGQLAAQYRDYTHEQ